MSFDAWPTQPSNRALNLNAGPSALPYVVLQEAQAELLDFRGTGMSVMEISHRSKVFISVYEVAVSDLRSIMNIPSEYSIVFMQGGASTQFSAIPLNLLGLKPADGDAKAHYIITGAWSRKAAEEAAKYIGVEVSYSNYGTNYTGVPTKQLVDTGDPSDSASSPVPPPPIYTYVCTNETVHGVELTDDMIFSMKTPGSLLVADMSSNICSKPINVGMYDVIYAGIQKNLGPSGAAIVIVKNSILNKACETCPIMLNWSVAIKNGGMYNTPPCFSIYMCGLVLKWIKKLGGLQTLQKVNNEKQSLLYTYLDNSELFKCCVYPPVRSHMNIVFVARDKQVEDAFTSYCKQANIIGIAGHRMVGGFRASLYNAIGVEQVKQLVSAMQEFEKQYNK